MALRRPLLTLILAGAALGDALVGGGRVLEPQQAHAAVVERVVAVVGERAILLSDVQRRARPFLVRVYDSVPAGPQQDAAISQVYHVLLERMVEEELEDRAARQAGIVVSADEVEQALERVAAQNGLPVGAVLAEAKRSGLSEDQYRDELRRQLLQAKVANVRLQGRIRVSENDVQAAYRRMVQEERMQLEQRLLRLELPLGSSAEEQQRSRALARQLVERARAGEDFRALVAQHSRLPVERSLTASHPPLRDPAPLQRATLALEVGEVSQPLQLGDALVILQVVERKDSSLPPYEEVREPLNERVYMEKMAEARKHWLDGLRARTHVDVRL